MVVLQLFAVDRLHSATILPIPDLEKAKRKLINDLDLRSKLELELTNECHRFTVLLSLLYVGSDTAAAADAGGGEMDSPLQQQRPAAARLQRITRGLMLRSEANSRGKCGQLGGIG